MSTPSPMMVALANAMEQMGYNDSDAVDLLVELNARLQTYGPAGAVVKPGSAIPRQYAAIGLSTSSTLRAAIPPEQVQAFDNACTALMTAITARRQVSRAGQLIAKHIYGL